MVNTDEFARFSCTQLYKDVELALHNLLIKKRDAVCPPHSSPAQHYYAAFSRPPNSRWADDSDQYADEEYDCKPPCPILGKDMKFKICQRDHSEGQACTDRVCFIPTASARKYMLGFIANSPRQSRSLSELEPVTLCLVRKYDSNIPSKDIEAFSSIVSMLLSDLRYAGRQTWDPEVHGVLNWRNQPFEMWVGDFIFEIHGVKWKRDMKEYL
ncbi:hypothetical protein H9Q69_013884 [Fusarium xylarioides]|uniref:Uncharacterized protein n=1 Tax=Fusarium xylarioides TaxID=221167 RepID=A0A9P7HH32_9HYPO|nr:hypothetical protein H9Q70_002670 [Fusarium xylarioides]KAG5759468.1 hypothetical protein H9Q72_012408 [Fusarium xylarioides]KAG5782921.1 hypothetical protein H9Q73_003404 [Fusarium xylarioides]KAG5787045.1 hypothetical protein H9Q69_013884 [Fusarium xylarioides]KAG5801469.1 hypothetical protein H9Q71_013943 [Fusarium xylarioides]